MVSPFFVKSTESKNPGGEDKKKLDTHILSIYRTIYLFCVTLLVCT